MPSLFPGMDPYVEGQKWRDFHSDFMTMLRAELVPDVRPKYVVDVEEYVYVVEPYNGDDAQLIEPDMSISESDEPWRNGAGAAAGGVALSPSTLTLPVPDRVRQRHLVIRTREGRNVVTVIEVLSPWNKRRGEGQSQYLVKRNNVLAGMTHLVEVDLLRGGTRLPAREPLPEGDCFAFVSASEQRPRFDVYHWKLRDALPAIPVPLGEGDEPVRLDLARAFTLTYDRAGYDYALDYSRDADPPLSEADAEWVKSLPVP